MRGKGPPTRLGPWKTQAPRLQQPRGQSPVLGLRPGTARWAQPLSPTVACRWDPHLPSTTPLLTAGRKEDQTGQGQAPLTSRLQSWRLETTESHLCVPSFHLLSCWAFPDGGHASWAGPGCLTRLHHSLTHSLVHAHVPQWEPCLCLPDLALLIPRVSLSWPGLGMWPPSNRARIPASLPSANRNPQDDPFLPGAWVPGHEASLQGQLAW